MGWPQTISGAILVVVLLALSLYYGWRQVRSLRGLRWRPDLPAEERSHERRLAWRRLVSSALMFVLAVLLAGGLIFLEGPMQRLVDRNVPATREFARLYGGWWVAFLVVLLAVVLLAGLDLLAVARWGLRQQRRLRADRRAMLQRQLTRLREEGNGHT